MTPDAPQRTASRSALLLGCLLFIAVETATQVVFKYAGEALDDSAGLLPLLGHALTTPVVLLGFALYFCGFLIWMTILREMDLGRAFPMTATIYLTTLAAAVVLFHEHLSPIRIAGVLVIIAGVAILALDSDKKTSSHPDADLRPDAHIPDKISG